jgi:hypothetical protein
MTGTKEWAKRFAQTESIQDAAYGLPGISRSGNSKECLKRILFETLLTKLVPAKKGVVS